MNLPATLPAITPENRGFWEAASRGELVLPHCEDCAHTWFPPTSHCPSCLGRRVAFRRASGRGSLWSWIVMHRAYFRDFPPPYVVAFVRLEEGPMVVSTILGADRDDLRCDLPVEAVFEKLSDEVSVLKFAPVA